MMEKRNIEEAGRTICEHCKKVIDQPGALCSKCSTEHKAASAEVLPFCNFDTNPSSFQSQAAMMSKRHNV